MGTPQSPDAGVYISNGQTYQEVRDLARTVDRIELKLDEVITATKDIRGDVADHEARLRTLEGLPKGDALDARVATLERAKWPLPSIGVLSGVAGAAAGIFALLR
ncbi:hypothetical protein [Streptomyces sp. NRRL B-24720]|uniref:hypothetical protein n=1 Tax=Streptomyces sp. NRRL B-24720 TaxID=1476876 RepID=UPI0004CC2BDC|nr:hypothetical protein [Streptomyces sp. NRRL B-24720]